MLRLREEADGRILSVYASGKLSREDYRGFLPEVERLIHEHGKIRVLFEMHDFHGWTVGALWEDIKFDARHFADIERLAMVGERKWQAGMAAFCKPFTKAKVRYFDQIESPAAQEWIRNDMAVAAMTEPNAPV